MRVAALLGVLCFGLRSLQLRLQLGHGWQLPQEGFRQRLRELVFRDSDGLVHVPEGVLGHHLVLAPAEQQPDGGGVVSVPKQVVHGRQVEVQLPGKLGLERHRLQLHHDVAPQTQVVEEHVEEEIVAAHLHPVLVADEGKTYAKLQEEVLDEEELLVLHPTQQRGYRVVLSGISDNFQLHLLLANALIGDPKEGWLEGRRPQAAEVQVATGAGPQECDGEVQGNWDLYQWTALNVDGALPETVGREHWVWNEGVPADIREFEGTRTLLLGKPAWSRSWNNSRTFDVLEAKVEVLEVLGAAELRALVALIAQAAKPE